MPGAVGAVLKRDSHRKSLQITHIGQADMHLGGRLRERDLAPSDHLFRFN